MNRPILLFFLLLSVFAIAQHQDKVDFTKGEIMIRPLPDTKEIKGHVTYYFDALDNVDSVFLNASHLQFVSVLLDGKKVNFSNKSNVISIYKKFKKGTSYKIFLDYVAVPKQTVYFLGWDDSIPDNEQIWTQGQGKYTSHWLPSFDAMEEKLEFDLNITFDKSYTVVANGFLSDIQEDDDQNTWKFDMRDPMSSYLLAFAIGKYNKQELVASSGIPIENYYYPQDSLKVEPTYRYTKEIFDFLEEEIGVPYPWQNYKQIPVRDFLYAGMENTGTTIFSDQYVIDSIAFVDKNYVNVNAHEMAHQWFGNLVTEKSGDHHWLHEGFATYYAYLTEKELFGDDHFYWKLYNSLEALQKVIDRGEGQSLLDAKASSLTFYEKGAWALFMLRNKIGDVAFKKGIKSYLNKYLFKNVTVSGFLREMEAANGKELNGFRKDWLENTLLPFENAKKQLAEISPSIKLLIELETGQQASKKDTIDFKKYWDASCSIHLKKYMLEHFKGSMHFDAKKEALELDTIPLRQTIMEIKAFDSLIPKEYLLDFLDDKSYISKELALFNLWQGYPEDRSKFLEKTKDVIGLPNKNVRLMWLTLAVLTDGYDATNTKKYFDELSGYTSPQYAFEIRQGAFFYLKEAFGFTEQNLMDLAQATTHHAWQFKNFARNMMDELLQDEVYKNRITALLDKLKPEEKRYIERRLE